jgi:LemA protein
MSWQAQKIKSLRPERFNETVRPYNNHIKIFPNSVLLVCLDLRKTIEAVAGAETPVEVQF